MWQDVLESTLQHELLVTARDRQLFINVTIKGVLIRALIDSGATGNFMHPQATVDNQ
jgi:hypothetical protein